MTLHEQLRKKVAEWRGKLRGLADELLEPHKRGNLEYSARCAAKGVTYADCADELESILNAEQQAGVGPVAYGVVYPASHPQAGQVWSTFSDRQSAEEGRDSCWNAGDDLIVPLYTAQTSDARGDGWIAFSDRWPNESPALDDPSVKTMDTVLVTNNLKSRDRMGRLCNVWLAAPIQGEREIVAFEGYNKIHGLTHWKDAGLSKEKPR